MKKIMKKFYNGLYSVVMFICKLLLIADVCITSYAVLGRYAGKYIPFISDPAWSEEIVLTCMIYMAFLSASLAIHNQAHIRMTSLDMYLPKKLCQSLDLLGDFLILAFALMMIFVGFPFAAMLGGKGGYVSLPWLSKFWLYAPIPFSGIAIALFQLEVIYKHICAFRGVEVDE